MASVARPSAAGIPSRWRLVPRSPRRRQWDSTGIGDGLGAAGERPGYLWAYAMRTLSSWSGRVRARRPAGPGALRRCGQPWPRRRTGETPSSLPICYRSVNGRAVSRAGSRSVRAAHQPMTTPRPWSRTSTTNLRTRMPPLRAAARIPARHCPTGTQAREPDAPLGRSARAARCRESPRYREPGAGIIAGHAIPT